MSDSALVDADGLCTALDEHPATNGIDHESVIVLDNIVTVPADHVGRAAGRRLAEKELMLTEAIHAAFDPDDA